MNDMRTMDNTVMNETKITARDVHVHYGTTHAIKGVDVDIADRTVTAFIGPDETVALGVVKPFHCSRCHGPSLWPLAVIVLIYRGCDRIGWFLINCSLRPRGCQPPAGIEKYPDTPHLFIAR